MNKKKTLKKREFSLADVEHIDISDREGLTEFKPSDYFKDHKRVAEALLQCLVENDTEAFMEILDSYLRVNRSKVAKKADLARSTVSTAFSKKSNPTLKTLAKIVSESVLDKRR
ncbi:hypothetical protein M1446_04235 [Candidatus Dependentiae bacterium]|nr:hypothetical protein [Candidatus Dependentiae bacterium]